MELRSTWLSVEFCIDSRRAGIKRAVEQMRSTVMSVYPTWQGPLFCLSKLKTLHERLSAAAIGLNDTGHSEIFET